MITPVILAVESSGLSSGVISALGAGSLGAILAAIVAGFFTRRKLGAEATEIITKAAAGVVTNLQAEINRQAGVNTQMRNTYERTSAEMRTEYEAELLEIERKMERMAAAHVQERGEWRRVLQLHVAWDAIAVAEMAKIGTQLPSPPPLLPAARYVDDKGYPHDVQ